MSFLTLSSALVCLLHLVAFSEGGFPASDAQVPMIFGRPDDILLFHREDAEVKAKHTAGVGSMKQFGGTIDFLAAEFNVSRRSSPGGRPPSPTFMLDLYNALQNQESGNIRTNFEKKAIRKSDTIRSITAKLVELTHHELSSQVLQRYAFDLTVLTRSERLRLAELRIPVPATQKRVKNMRVTLYQLLEVPCEGDGDARDEAASSSCYRRDTVTSQRVKQDHLDENDGSVVFQVTKAVKRWVKTTRGKHVVEVGVPDDLVDDIIKVREDLIDSEAQLVTFTYTKVKGEKKGEKSDAASKKDKKRERGTRDADDDATEARRQKKRREKSKAEKKKKLDELEAKKSREPHPCKKEDLIVDFEEIGWGDWIIYPKKFNAYQCVGKCPAPMDNHHNPNNHAIIRGLFHLRDPDTLPLPCCVPTKLAPLSMLYYEHGKIVVKEHEDMVAEECGCR